MSLLTPLPISSQFLIDSPSDQLRMWIDHVSPLFKTLLFHFSHGSIATIFLWPTRLSEFVIALPFEPHSLIPSLLFHLVLILQTLPKLPHWGTLALAALSPNTCMPCSLSFRSSLKYIFLVSPSLTTLSQHSPAFPPVFKNSLTPLPFLSYLVYFSLHL